MAFDADAYLRANPDVAQAIQAGQIPSAQDHFERFGKAEGREIVPTADSAYFNPNVYLQRNQDVADAIAAGQFGSAQEHWNAHGRFEGRDWQSPMIADAFQNNYGKPADPGLFNFVSAMGAAGMDYGPAGAGPNSANVPGVGELSYGPAGTVGGSSSFNDTGGDGGLGGLGGMQQQADPNAAFMDMMNQLMQQQMQMQQNQFAQNQQMMQGFMNSQQGWQSGFSDMLGSWQNSINQPNAPTFGPGSGGNFGGQISPVYRPRTQGGGEEQPRNGWGGPWTTSNPFSPTM